MKRRINSLLAAMTLVRFGQELGSDSPAARAVHEIIQLLISLPAGFCR
jgi:hypothetical protein